MTNPISVSKGVRALVEAALLGVWVCRLPVAAASVAAVIPVTTVPAAAVPVAAMRVAGLLIVAVLLLIVVPPAERCKLLFPPVPTPEHISSKALS